MKLRTQMWMILGMTLVVMLGVDLAVAWRRIHADQRAELEIDVHTIRAAPPVSARAASGCWLCGSHFSQSHRLASSVSTITCKDRGE